VLDAHPRSNPNAASPLSCGPCPGGSKHTSLLHAAGAESTTAEGKKEDHPSGSGGTGKRVSKVAAQGTLCKFAGIFLGSHEAPTCFKTKCEGGNSPSSANVCLRPLPEDSCTVQNIMVCSIPRLTKSEEMTGHMHQAYAPHIWKGKESGSLSEGRIEEGVTGRCLQPRLQNKQGPPQGQRASHRWPLCTEQQHSTNSPEEEWDACRPTPALSLPPPNCRFLSCADMQ
jgi:hypothetical protein